MAADETVLVAPKVPSDDEILKIESRHVERPPGGDISSRGHLTEVKRPTLRKAQERSIEVQTGVPRGERRDERGRRIGMEFGNRSEA